ncbi:MULTISPECIES: alkaline phosphatase family protein [unclassified Pseudoalteromonas]|uniref:alkaline phosphatase family protein n=1 Tax=unclassified Pseudoalteromonas TaxID=194690 RepID=UPI001F3976C1|nr:ectonucleotide pyrophosphatase/phosphodiesterase [Pseudoalteromonas sp. L21]MCF7518220.1 ectonucleotide pyrophosphatase/phosphodiesterase [Pseudoalteromonas sp. L21]|tara:strand:+ start:3221 stop:4411 length:1191 start_codon:yes stop_codon:yes gene_type:complete
MRIWPFIFFALLASSAVVKAAEEQSVVLISIDGFRWDYIEKHDAKNLKIISEQGVRATKMRPVYPTKTFPNHVSIITGLLPVNHGIVDNRFCDTERNECYKMGKGKDDSTWLNGIPLWNLAQMQGVKAATYFWPESDARFNGMLPDYFYHYSKHSDYQKRVDQIIQWLSLPKAQRPRLVVSYFSLVDSMGHEYGPDAQQTYDAVQQLDSLMADLHTRLKALDENINLVIVSDHGMASVDPSMSIKIDSLPKDDNFMVQNTGPRVLYYAKPNSKADIKGFSKKLAKAEDGRYIVLTDQQKRDYYYDKGPRVGDIVLQTTAPRVFTDSKMASYLGTHGYAYTDDMAATFIATGPAFKRHVQLDEVNNLDVYPLIAKLLGLKILSPIDSDGETLWPAIK